MVRRADVRKVQKRARGAKPRKEREHVDLSRPDGDVELEVYEPEIGLRIDRFLSDRLPWRSRAQVVRLIEEGRVLLNGGAVAKPAKRVAHFDRVLVRVLPGEFEDPGAIPLEVIYEDAHLLALNKQPGLVCHPAGRVRSGTLMNALHARYRRPDRPLADIVPRLCHRLDKDTSGVILVAKSERVRRRMQWIFEEKLVAKDYLAIARGLLPRDYAEVQLPLGPAGPDARIRISMAVREDGLPSRTIVCAEERFPLAGAPGGGYTLARCSPVTGRQHQIRVHLAALGFAILGDSIYGDAPHGSFAFPGVDEPLLCRQALHAHRIQLPHPVFGELDLTAPLPEDMRAAIAHLRARAAPLRRLSPERS